MPSHDLGSRKVAVIGGGIAGLAAAHRLLELAPESELVLFESSRRVGGVLQTEHEDGYLVEHSADNFLTKLPWAEDLCRRVGISDSLLPTNTDRRRAFVVRNGRVLPTPESFVILAPGSMWSVLSSPALSWRGKFRLCFEPLVPRRRADAGDETVASFARRRLGMEAFERLAQPLLAGIYTADPNQLSMAATMPQFLEQEREHGSLWRAARRTKRRTKDSGASYSKFVAPRGGMQQLVDAVAARLPAGCIRTATPVGILERSEGQWRLASDDGRVLGEFDAVILATPAPAAARLIQPVDTELAKDLCGIQYAGVSIVCFGFRTDQIKRPVEGFGFVAPAVERRKVVAVSFASHKFPDRAPPGYTLVRVFIGGALQADLADLPDPQLIRLALDELRDLIGVAGEPSFQQIARWPSRMPQYHLGHLERVARIDRRLEGWPGLEVAGAAYRGVGVPQCIQSGEQAAERVAETLSATGGATAAQSHSP